MSQKLFAGPIIVCIAINIHTPVTKSQPKKVSSLIGQRIDPKTCCDHKGLKLCRDEPLLVLLMSQLLLALSVS